MKWRNSELNKYPDIILHDCFVDEIQPINDNLVLTFSKYGFFKIIKEKNNYFRTKGGEIVVQGCLVEECSTSIVKTYQQTEQGFADLVFDIEVSDFIQKVNTKEWKLEIVEEFYASNACLFKGMIHSKQENMWCYIKLFYKSLEYQWNEVCFDWPF